MTGRVELVELWDGRQWPGRVRNGVPEFGWRQAPDGLSTRQQLRAKGLSPGGQEPFGRIVWKRNARQAALYVEAKAKPKRVPTPAQLAAIDKALAARKVCAECGPVDHFVRTTDHLCGDCHEAGVEPTAGGTTGWRTVQDWQTEADNEEEDHAHVGDSQASSAAARAAAALARTAVRVEAGRQPKGHDTERDEQLARWHADDQTRRTAAEHTAEHTDDRQQWRDERGVA